ncbi:DUF3592 domain-containing protein [Altererythrobacter sp. FM1]|uniref:DUF3592 domain-containing protein n=1 Tax=Tsuneonella flava TaxID=2055955 RepID=UPI000C80F282|nr:DUF3592 domain-containing protein [Tsuneonella flava]ROT93470.1 DUF3592 domain-containing protein [Altererythrobacter sp. FM1]
MKNLFRWVGGIFAATGFIFLTASAVLWQRDADFSADAEKARGTVIELVRHVERDRDRGQSISYTAIIGYTDGSGRRLEFSETVRSNPPRFSVGEDVPVLYDPKRSSHAVVDDFWGRRGMLTIFLGLGATFAALGAVLFAIDLKRGRKISRLLREGKPIDADFLHVFRDTRIKRNGEHPFRVVAQATDPATGRLRRFESEAIWVDPTTQLTGRKIRVLLDPSNPQRYHVDLPGSVSSD